MDQEIEIISSETRKEKIKNFFLSNKKILIIILIFLILISFGFFSYQIYLENQRKSIAHDYNRAIIEFQNGDQSKVKLIMKDIIKDKDRTYSPLAFYFLFDNDLINSNEETNIYFDILINETDLEKENKNLIIFKKGLFNSDFVNENELLGILNPVINSESAWKPHALYLMAEFYLSKNEKLKSKEFFNTLVNLENISPKIKLEVQKRLRSDFSD